MAFPEIARVLRPGGVLAAMWNGDDLGVGWVPGLHDATTSRRRVLSPYTEPTLPVHPSFTAPSEHSRHPNAVRPPSTGSSTPWRRTRGRC